MEIHQRKRRPALLQQLITTFPQGSPGFGLLVLRIVIAAGAAIQGWLNLEGGETSSAVAITGMIFLMGSLSIVAGLLTPIGAAIVLLAAAAALFLPAYSHSAEALISLVFLGALAISAALVGPGWLSLDRLIFGRREIILPRRVSQSTSGTEVA